MSEAAEKEHPYLRCVYRDDPDGGKNCGTTMCREAGTCLDTTMTWHEAHSTPGEFGAGMMLDGWGSYCPSVNCIECGRFVGRDGHIEVEHFEMSSKVASVEGQCRRCIDRGNCLICSGTGEGVRAGQTCIRCKGTGKDSPIEIGASDE